MKFAIPFAILFSFGALTAPKIALSGPVIEHIIPDGVDWFVHVDVEKLQATRTGSAFTSEFRDIVPIPNKEELPIDPLLIADGLQGLTVFGTIPDFTAETFVPDAVVILEGTPDLIQVFKGLVSGFQIENPEAIVPVENNANGILSLMNGEFFGAFLDEKRVVLSKSLPGMDNFYTVFRGDTAHINLAERFAVNTADDSKGIFFGAFVEGLSDYEDLPVQARILKLTQAVSVQMGEQGEYLNLLTSLVTDQPQTAAQVSEVLKGLIAVFALTQNGNPEVAALVQSSNVSLNERTVTLAVSYPVEAAVKWASVLAQKAKEEMAKEEMEAETADETAPAVEVEAGTETKPAGDEAESIG